VANCSTPASGAEGSRPSVRVLALQARNIDLQSVFWGLEEEGIPFDVQEVAHGGAVALAKEAAQMSPLNVGIAVNGVEGSVVLHHRDLPADQPLFVINLRNAPPRELRRLGINAARLVKAEPLLLKDEPVSEPPPPSRGNHTANVSDEVVERIVQSVLAEITKVRGKSWKKTASA